MAIGDALELGRMAILDSLELASTRDEDETHHTQSGRPLERCTSLEMCLVLRFDTLAIWDAEKLIRWFKWCVDARDGVCEWEILDPNFFNVFN